VINQPGIGIGLSGCWDVTHIRCEVWNSGRNRPGFWCDVDTGVDPYNRGGHKYIDCIAEYNDLDGLICNCSNVEIRGGRYNHNGLAPVGGAIGSSGIYNDRRQDNWIVVGVTCDHNTEFGINGVFYYSIFDSISCKDNGLSGFFFRPGSGRSKIIGSEFLRNGNSPTSLNPNVWGKAGIQFDGVFDIQIIGCTAVDERGGASTQTYGIQNMNNSTSNFVKVICNTFKFNKTDDSNIDPDGYSATVPSNCIYEFNGGIRRKNKATFNGNGSNTTFTIPHGLGATPLFVNVTPGSNDAKGNFYVTADANNIMVTYAAAPPSGSNNVVLWWEAEA